MSASGAAVAVAHETKFSRLGIASLEPERAILDASIQFVTTYSQNGLTDVLRNSWNSPIIVGKIDNEWKVTDYSTISGKQILDYSEFPDRVFEYRSLMFRPILVALGTSGGQVVLEVHNTGQSHWRLNDAWASPMGYVGGIPVRRWYRVAFSHLSVGEGAVDRSVIGWNSAPNQEPTGFDLKVDFTRGRLRPHLTCEFPLPLPERP